MPEGQIQTISDAIAVALKLEKDKKFIDDGWQYHRFPFGLWFRGQPEPGLPLLPPVFRQRTKETVPPTLKYYDETNFYEHLRSRCALHRQQYPSAFDWLCLMQHYSMPTRLLDWSESILPALYFAVNLEPKENGELIVLNARRLNKLQNKRPTICTPTNPQVIIRSEMAATRSSKTLARTQSVKEAIEDPEDGKRKDWLQSYRTPIAVFPYRLNERMVFQSSVFTLHGGKVYGKGLRKKYKGEDMPEPVSLEDIQIKTGRTFIKRFTVPWEQKEKIRHGLFILGIHEGTLFPEIDRQASYLKELW